MSSSERSESNDPKLAAFLQGSTPWSGRTDILVRRKQVPDSSYGPQEVVRKCLDAFQVNDDPQLDHGCCVLLGFKSPLGPLAESGLDPAAYGRFLRASPDYSLLVDHSNSDLIGEPEPIKDSLSVRQSVKVQGWRLGSGSEVKNFDFYLTKIDDKWLIDVVLIRR